MANGDYQQTTRNKKARRPLREHGNVDDWMLIRQTLRPQFPDFDYEVTQDSRGRVQVITKGHPTRNGRQLSRRELIEHCRGTKPIAFDPPGTPLCNPPRRKPPGRRAISDIPPCVPYALVG